MQVLQELEAINQKFGKLAGDMEAEKATIAEFKDNVRTAEQDVSPLCLFLPL